MRESDAIATFLYKTKGKACECDRALEVVGEMAAPYRQR